MMTHTTSNKDQIVVNFRLQRGDDITTRSLTFDGAVSSPDDTTIGNALAQLRHCFMSTNTLAKHYTKGTGEAAGTWADYADADSGQRALMTVPWNQVIQPTSFEDVTAISSDAGENPWTCIGVSIERRLSTTHYYTTDDD